MFGFADKQTETNVTVFTIQTIITASVAEWLRAWDTLTMFEATGGREFDPRSGHYSRISFSSDQVTGTVFSSVHAFPYKLLIYLEHYPRGEAVISLPMSKAGHILNWEESFELLVAISKLTISSYPFYYNLLRLHQNASQISWVCAVIAVF